MRKILKVTLPCLCLGVLLLSGRSEAAQENIDTLTYHSVTHMKAHEISPRLKTSELTFNYKSDTMSTVRGGLHKQTNYLGNFLIASTLDLQEMFGFTSTSFGFQFVGIHGSAPTDANGDFQGASNLQATPGWNLYEAWLQKTAFDEKLSLLAGLRDVNSDFNVTDSSLVFLNSSFGMGPELSTSGMGAPSTFPVTALGARARVQPLEILQVQFGIFDGVPGDPKRPQQTAVRLSKQDGAFLISEIAITPTINGQPGKFGVGGWMYTARMQDLSDKIGIGAPSIGFASSALAEEGLETITSEQAGAGGVGEGAEEAEGSLEKPLMRRSQGAYFIAEQKLFSPKEGQEEGLASFFRAGVASPHSNPIGYSVQTGFSYKNIFSKNRGDQLGLGMALAGVSSHNRRALEASGITVTNQEASFEMTYQKKITTWLSLQPDFQWIVNPGFNADTKTAYVAAARIEVSL